MHEDRVGDMHDACLFQARGNLVNERVGPGHHQPRHPVAPEPAVRGAQFVAQVLEAAIAFEWSGRVWGVACRVTEQPSGECVGADPECHEVRDYDRRANADDPDRGCLALLYRWHANEIALGPDHHERERGEEGRYCRQAPDGYPSGVLARGIVRGERPEIILWNRHAKESR